MQRLTAVLWRLNQSLAEHGCYAGKYRPLNVTCCGESQSPITNCEIQDNSMTTVYLNGSYLPMSEAKISPMDRGFLFGDGIYEVIPSYHGRIVGFAPHIERMQKGLNALSIDCALSQAQWQAICEALINRNGGGNLGLYLHISRGADSKRFHAFPEGLEPTVFAYTFEIPPEPVADKSRVKAYRVCSTEDLRWDRCHIKSTALLGNVLHFQQGVTQNCDETILFNQNNELTEAAACNVFVVKNGVVATPPLDNQLLPGITRQLLIDILRKDGSMTVEERVIDMSEVRGVDEIWLTSSSKEIAPVIELDGAPVGDGTIGDLWLSAQTLFSAHKYEY